jgi:hypothetical protein
MVVPPSCQLSALSPYCRAWNVVGQQGWKKNGIRDQRALMLAATMPAAGVAAKGVELRVLPACRCFGTNQAKSLHTTWRGATLEVHTQHESLLNKGLAGLRNVHRATVPHFHC